MANIETDRGTREKVRFLDTEGLDWPGSSSSKELLPRHLLPLADGFLLVYAVDDERSFQLAEAVRRDVEKNGNRDKKAEQAGILLAQFRYSFGSSSWRFLRCP